MTPPIRLGAFDAGTGRLVLASLVATLACGAAPRPSDAEIYRLAADALREEIAAPSPILLHPLLVRRDTAGAPDLDRGSFNPFDSSSVPEVISLADTELAPCTTNEAGSCIVPEGSVALVLSELQDLGANGVVAAAVVLDGREGRPRRRYFLVRVKATGDAWEVVEIMEQGTT